jgi:hypothetical protein
VRGAAYLRALLRQDIASRLTGANDASGESRDRLAELREQGFLDLQGIPMPRELFAEISQIDLVRDMTRAPGCALIVQVSASQTPKPELERLRSHLVELGAACSLKLAKSADAVRFGGPKFRGVGDGKKVDLQSGIAQELTKVTNGWARGRSEGSVDP